MIYSLSFVRIVVIETYIKTQGLPAETVNCSVNGETKRLQFIITVYMPPEVWSLRYKHSPFTFVSFAPFGAFWVYSFQTKSNCFSICVNSIVSMLLMNTGIAKFCRGSIYICLHGKQFATLITVGTQFATVINFWKGIATVISAEVVHDRYNCREVVCDNSLLKKSGILLLQLMEKLSFKKNGQLCLDVIFGPPQLNY